MRYAFGFAFLSARSDAGTTVQQLTSTGEITNGSIKSTGIYVRAYTCLYIYISACAYTCVPSLAYIIRSDLIFIKKRRPIFTIRIIIISARTQQCGSIMENAKSVRKFIYYTPPSDFSEFRRRRGSDKSFFFFFYFSNLLLARVVYDRTHDRRFIPRFIIR